MNIMRPVRFEAALSTLKAAVQEVESALEEMRSQHDPLASCIFVARRNYRSSKDTKGGRRHAMCARLTYDKACAYGFRGTLGEWERLMGAAPPR